MKKIILTIVLAVAATVSANAQLRVEAGINLGNYSIDFSKLSTRIAPKVSLLYSLPEGDMFGTELGLQFATFNVGNENAGNRSYGSKMSISDIQIPIREYVDFRITDKFTIRPGIGTYIGTSVAGTTTRADGTTASPFGDDGLKRFDFGIDDELAFVFNNHLSISIGSQHCVINRSKSPDVKIKNNAFYLTVGWMFR